MRWDLFCRVIDNHGDAGVCWRVARELAERGEHVRLWLDDTSMLAWMAPEGHARVEVRSWPATAGAAAASFDPGDVVIEAFGCDPPDAFVAAMRSQVRPPAWINLEYLSAEPYVERSHGLPSPVSAGPGAGLVKHFFYPGFTARTGGLLRERDLEARQSGFAPSPGDGARRVSLFCYEPPALPDLLQALATAPTRLLVTEGRARRACEAALARLDAQHPGWNAAEQLFVEWLPLLSQRDYDHLLWSCDLNFVRGEDSLVRALLAGKPFVWNIYPQDDGAHVPKLQAFLDWLGAPPSLRKFHAAWNGLEPGSTAIDWDAWAGAAARGREKAFALPELAASLLAFAGERARI